MTTLETRTPTEAALEATAEALAFRIAEAKVERDAAGAAACWDVAAALGLDHGKMNARISRHYRNLVAG